MIHHVGMADAKVARGSDALRTLGLGSCVGVTLFDAAAQVAGLAHVMLPSAPSGTEDVFKYADTAIPLLLSMVVQEGADRTRLRAKLAGGAQMFAFSKGMDLVRIGPRNVEAIYAQLDTLRIPVIAADVGGNFGRTIQIQCDTGQLWVRTVQHGEHYI
ncbi:chemotaxis protein CheD [Sulfoacidibacillus thermotolerans]|uniref:Probable chemoreceptor glutamine deamidase CheD n=1 Tax=Sulfoacidibacillus thermotolerans TaxID=1765684 RepID=A0A2U3DA98_SULT2|nr:chemotaxis protein CheD [Sulfoacidibacillus thermotolerans]PWI58206.1 chemotaxis protein CheD [Sulfoacidibacillus thermotolerans]